MSDSTKHNELPEFLRDLPCEGDMTTPNNYFRVMQNSVLERMALEPQPTATEPTVRTRRRTAPAWWMRPITRIAFVFLLVVGAIVWLNVAEVGPDPEILTEAEATEYILDQFELEEDYAEIAVESEFAFTDYDEELDYYLSDLAF